MSSTPPRAILLSLAFILTFGFAVQPLSAQEAAAMTLDEVAAAYNAGDLKTAREGLLPLAQGGEAVAQYRLGYMLAKSEGGPFDRPGAIKWIEAALAQEYNAGHTLLARVYLTGNPEIVDYERAAELLQYSLDSGEAEAAMLLGGLYRTGRGVEGNKEKAFELMHAAAKASLQSAQFVVSQMYARGEGVGQDDAQASRWLLTAAEAGHGAARLSLYYNYARGTGFPKDEAKALEWLVSAASVGNTTAERVLGTSLLLGKGIEANPEEGIKLLLRAGEKGDPSAQSNLGYAYITGTGVEKDTAQAAFWYQKAADQRLIRAALVVGDMYQTGEGLEQDLEAAVKYYRIAWSGRDETAAQRLGALIMDGSLAEEDHPEQSYEWIAAFAETGDENAINWLESKSVFEPYAHYRLGRIFDDGLGVDADAERAAKHFIRAAERGFAPAQSALSELYATGQGVELDHVEAHKWANVAAANGEDAALERRDVLAQLMTPEQIAEAQKRARDFLKTQ